jgi:hypothetical protein
MVELLRREAERLRAEMEKAQLVQQIDIYGDLMHEFYQHFDVF